MKVFIVATDFSPEAENAIEYAGAAARQLQAKVILFNSYSYSIHASNARLPASSMQKLEEHNIALLQERAVRLSKAYGIEVDYESGLMLEVGEGLGNLMAKHQAEMVIMGMAARSLAQELFGNTTTSVIMKQEFPVLAVPLGFTFAGIKKILFACEEPSEVPPKIMRKIKGLASSLGAVVEVFHVDDKMEKILTNEKDQASLNDLDKGLEGTNHYYKNVESGAVIKEIEKEIKDANPDLLIMIPQRHAFWDAFIHRSKTRIMASNNDVPLFSIPV